MIVGSKKRYFLIMKINLHKNARTTPAQREFIQNNPQMNISELASIIGVSETTIRRWKRRSYIFDRPHTPKRINTALTPIQELLVVLVRLCLRSGLDDLLKIVNRFILSDCSRSSLNRCLTRYHISRLSPIQRQLQVDTKDYRGTYFYHSVIQLPRLAFRGSPMVIESLLDCSFRWCYARLTPQPQQPSLPFIKKAIKDFPLTVLGIITGSPVCFMEKDTDFQDFSQLNLHTVEKFCRIKDIECHHTEMISDATFEHVKKLCHIIEKGNGNFSENIVRPWYLSGIQNIITEYHAMNQRALRQKTPLQALTDHYKNFPGSFLKKPKQSSETVMYLVSGGK